MKKCILSMPAVPAISLTRQIEYRNNLISKAGTYRHRSLNSTQSGPGAQNDNKNNSHMP